MTQVGKIITLFISDPIAKEKIEKESIEVDEQGIIDDKYYNKDINRSILLTSKRSYNLALSHGIKIPKGALGENLLMDYNPYTLNTGAQLYIGETILEISQNCTICSHLSIIDERVPELLKNDRGVFAKVVKGGKIYKSDDIFID